MADPLCDLGHPFVLVRQVRAHGDYVLTTKVVSLGLTFLSSSGIVDALRNKSGEFGSYLRPG